jgi:hypothetical protein
MNIFFHDKNKSGKDWFLSFMKRHPLSLRKPEAMSVSRAEGLNREDVNDFFSKLALVMNGAVVLDKPNLIYDVDETRCVLNSCQSLKFVSETGSKIVVKQSVLKGGTGNHCCVLQC